MALLVLLLAAGSAHLVYEGLVNLIYFSQVEATVERVALVPAQPGTLAGRAVESAVAYVRYVSPADGREHHGQIVPIGKFQLRRVRQFRPGESWVILAHKDDPRAIKMLN
ncbi:MAG: hypothetical protein FJW31_19085 [Acidobacteria bacterium]|nr:hypothetical protein [Acidobacteriota bacterium]